jgi:hypothetical protein
MFAYELSWFRRWPNASRPAIAAGCALALAGCQGEVVTIGEKPEPTFHCVSPRLVLELAAYARTNNATLTADLLEIYFTSTRDDDDFDIWTAARSSRYEPFGMPAKVRTLSSSRIDTGSAVSPDGLTLWLGSDRRPGGGGGGGGNNGGLDIWVSTRAARTMEWGEPVLAPGLSSSSFDIPRPPGAQGLVMPLGTERGPGSVYRTYFAKRASTTSPFETPEPVPELTFETATTMDAFLSNDGLTLLYASGPIAEANDGGISATVDGGTNGGASDASIPIQSADLFMARREKITDPFSRFTPIAELNTFFDERDPWMSEDKTQLYFSSDRGGNMNIYTCDVIFK